MNGSVGSYPDNMYQINVISGEIEAVEITPSGGNFTEPLLVSMACLSPGAQIRYTQDGNEPTEASAVYSVPLLISMACTLKARAFVAGVPPGPTTTDVFSFDRFVATPGFTPPSGNYQYHIVLQMFCATPGAAIYYSMDGSEPSQESALYSVPLLISQTTTVKARAFLENWEPSEIATAQYVYGSTIQDNEEIPDAERSFRIYPNPVKDQVPFLSGIKIMVENMS